MAAPPETTGGLHVRIAVTGPGALLESINPTASPGNPHTLPPSGRQSPPSPTPSLSSSASQASPSLSPSESVWAGLGTTGQLSSESGTKSLSPSGAIMVRDHAPP